MLLLKHHIPNETPKIVYVETDSLMEIPETLLNEAHNVSDLLPKIGCVFTHKCVQFRQIYREIEDIE
jgi:hypothetical protein